MSGGRNLIKITVNNDGAISERSFEMDTVLVGREDSGPLRVNHPDISRRHLTITRRGYVLFVEDLGSSNGTYINGEVLTARDPKVLHPGIKVCLGSANSVAYLQAEIVNRASESPSSEKEKSREKVEEIIDSTINERSYSFSKKMNSSYDLQRPPPPPPPVPPVLKKPIYTLKTQTPEKLGVVQQAGIVHAAELEVEKILQRARREADEILKRAQLGAEEKNRGVFEEAQAARQSAEDFYRDRVQDAYKAAEEIYDDARNETTRILENTGRVCDEQRRDANDRIAELRRKAKLDCEALLAAAETMARQLKETRLAEADASLQRREQEIRQAITDELAGAREDHLRKMAAEAALQESSLRTEREAAEQEIELLYEERDKLRENLTGIENTYVDVNRTVTTLSNEKTALMKATKELMQSRDTIDIQATELKQLVVQLELDANRKKREVDSLNADVQKISIEKENSDRSLAKLRASSAEFKEENGEYEAQHKEIKKIVTDLKAQEKQLLTATETLESKKQTLEVDFLQVKKRLDQSQVDLTESKKEHENLSRRNQELIEKRETFAANIEKELAGIKIRFDQQKEKFKKDEEDQLAYLSMETTKRIQKLEKDFLAEISRRKATVVKEICISLEGSSKVIGANLSDWRKESDQVEHNVQLLLEGQILNLKSEGGITPQKVNVTARRRMEKMKSFSSGMMLSAILFAAGYGILGHLQGPSPLARLVASESQARKEDLQARRFNPVKVSEFKANYVDAVIYTDRFYDIYTTDDYQKKWTRAATKYLLKTWKVDEDSSLQALSISLTLVKNLHERKEKLHPDFLKDGLNKMRLTEDEAIKRMSTLLGSAVRVESLKRFEKDFFLGFRDHGEVLDGGN